MRFCWILSLKTRFLIENKIHGLLNASVMEFSRIMRTDTRFKNSARANHKYHLRQFHDFHYVWAAGVLSEHIGNRWLQYAIFRRLRFAIQELQFHIIVNRSFSKIGE